MKGYSITACLSFSDHNRETPEVIFSRRSKETPHLPLHFNKNSIKQMLFHKHVGVYLDGKLDFVNILIQDMFKKVDKTIGSLHKLQNDISRAPLAMIFKATFRLWRRFMWPNV